MRSAMQMPIEARTLGYLLTLCAGIPWQGALTIDWCKPENNSMKKPGSKGADDAHKAEKRNGKQDSLKRVTVGQVSASPGLKDGQIPYGEYE